MEHVENIHEAESFLLYRAHWNKKYENYTFKTFVLQRAKSINRLAERTGRREFPLKPRYSKTSGIFSIQTSSNFDITYILKRRA